MLSTLRIIAFTALTITATRISQLTFLPMKVDAVDSARKPNGAPRNASHSCPRRGGWVAGSGLFIRSDMNERPNPVRKKAPSSPAQAAR